MNDEAPNRYANNIKNDMGMNHVVVMEYITEKYPFLNNQAYTVEIGKLEQAIPEIMFDMNQNSNNKNITWIIKHKETGT